MYLHHLATLDANSYIFDIYDKLSLQNLFLVDKIFPTFERFFFFKDLFQPYCADN